MGAIKLELYPQNVIRKSDLARALSVPARLTILKVLIEEGRVNGTQLLKVLNLSQPTIHHHIDALKMSGLIRGDFFGEDYYWFLNKECKQELDAIHWFLED